MRNRKQETERTPRPPAAATRRDGATVTTTTQGTRTEILARALRGPLGLPVQPTPSPAAGPESVPLQADPSAGRPARPEMLETLGSTESHSPLSERVTEGPTDHFEPKGRVIPSELPGAGFEAPSRPAGSRSSGGNDPSAALRIPVNPPELTVTGLGTGRTVPPEVEGGGRRPEERRGAATWGGAATDFRPGPDGPRAVRVSAGLSGAASFLAPGRVSGVHGPAPVVPGPAVDWTELARVSGLGSLTGGPAGISFSTPSGFPTAGFPAAELGGLGGQASPGPSAADQGSAIDLSKTNELLQQLLDEVRRGRQPFLPVADRGSSF